MLTRCASAEVLAARASVLGARVNFLIAQAVEVTVRSLPTVCAVDAQTAVIRVDGARIEVRDDSVPGAEQATGA